MNMTDAIYEREKARILALTEVWVPRLNLERYTIQSCWHRVTDSRHDHNIDNDPAGEVRVRWEYEQATVCFFLDETMSMDDKDLQSTVVHELCHIIVNPMRECRRKGRFEIKFEELVVTRLTAAFIVTYEAGAGIRDTQGYLIPTPPPEVKQQGKETSDVQKTEV